MGEAYKGSPAGLSPVWGCTWWVKINLRLCRAETGLSLVRQNPGVTEKVVDSQKSPRQRPASYYFPMHVTSITLFY